MAIEDLKKLTEQLSANLNIVFNSYPIFPVTTADEHDRVMEMLEELEREKANLENAVGGTYSIHTALTMEKVVGTGLPIEEEIAILERRKKHCKNYLEMKQIDRQLNDLKRDKRKRK